jgi:hypothetical protein
MKAMKMPARYLVVVTVLAAACSTAPQTAPQTRGAPVSPARPNVNLSGYPPEFRQGYADGCSSAQGRTVRNETRMKGDIQYAAGWRDGNDICRRR